MTAADRLAIGFARLAFEAGGRMTAPRLPILIFHRVLAETDPLLPAEMTAARFDALCAHLAATYRVGRLSEAAGALGRGRLPRRSLAITFDDGYADNAEIAVPILRRHGLVASFFVATGFLDGGRMFNDTVIESLRRSTRPTLDLGSIGLGRHPIATLDERRQAMATLLSRIKYLPPGERERAVRRLHESAGAPSLPDHLMMRSDQVRGLVQAGMEVGAHTVSHPILAALPDDQAEREIAGSRERLEAIVGGPIDTFAYPNGGYRQDFDERHVAMVRRLGFRVAVTTERGAARAGDDPLALPRTTPWQTRLWRWSAQLAHSVYASRGFVPRLGTAGPGRSRPD